MVPNVLWGEMCIIHMNAFSRCEADHISNFITYSTAATTMSRNDFYVILNNDAFQCVGSYASEATQVALEMRLSPMR